jgi:hypothetical protein
MFSSFVYILLLVIPVQFLAAAPVALIDYSDIMIQRRPTITTTTKPILELLHASLLKRMEDDANAMTGPEPDIDGGAGTRLDGAAWGAIIGGSALCLIFVFLICWCGRRRNW